VKSEAKLGQLDEKKQAVQHIHNQSKFSLYIWDDYVSNKPPMGRSSIILLNVFNIINYCYMYSICYLQ